jgi:tetrathionate reductase subunit B
MQLSIRESGAQTVQADSRYMTQLPTTRRDLFRGIVSARGGRAGPPEPAIDIRGSRPGPRWGMVVDLARCIGCQACTVSCIHENAVPEDSFRTIVSTYEVMQGDTARMAMLPRLCNHCEDPPCIPVCPVAATFQRPDGIVVIDADACVGCAYCVQACPYDARFINEDTGKADKCTFCAHRVDAGLLPACVESCVGGARVFGDLHDPHSTVSRMLVEAAGGTRVLRPEMNTHPQVFYLGLDPDLDGKVEGAPSLWQPTLGGKES